MNFCIVSSAVRALIIALSLSFLCAPMVSNSADLTIIVDPVKANLGDIRAAIFNEPDAFPSKRLRGQKVASGTGTVTLVFKDLPPGRYAVSAFQDYNQNEKLDTNLLGMPREPYGFSREARGRFGPPKFDDAAFAFGTEGKTLRIRLQ